MTTVNKTSKVVSRIWIVMSACLGLMLFIALSQPVWNAEKMIAEIKENCDKRGGVLLENKRMFGTTYECASRLD